MTQLKRIFSAILARLRCAWKAVKAQPFGVLAAVCGIAAAILAVLLPRSLPKTINSLNLAVAKRLAGTGYTPAEPIRAAALTLLWKTALVAALYLLAIWCALRWARKLRSDLRTAVHLRRVQHEAAGHTPPPDWENAVGRDIDHISAMAAAAPEWLMLIAGVVLCVMLLLRTPAAGAVWIPITAVAVCIIRDVLRQRRVYRALQALAVAAVWSAGSLLMVLRTLQVTESGVPLGTLVLLLIGMALVVPAALQVPYRTLRPAWEAYRRVSGFLR